MRLAFAGILLIAAVARCQTLPPDVARLVTLKDRASALLAGVVESAPFQKCRKPSAATTSLPTTTTVAINTSKP